MQAAAKSLKTLDYLFLAKDTHFTGNSLKTSFLSDDLEGQRRCKQARQEKKSDFPHDDGSVVVETEVEVELVGKTKTGGEGREEKQKKERENETEIERERRKKQTKTKKDFRVVFLLFFSLCFAKALSKNAPQTTGEHVF